MAAKIETEKGLTAELIEGGSGIFDVALDGGILFSKDATGRFPDEDEILALLS